MEMHNKNGLASDSDLNNRLSCRILTSVLLAALASLLAGAAIYLVWGTAQNSPLTSQPLAATATLRSDTLSDSIAPLLPLSQATFPERTLSPNLTPPPIGAYLPRTGLSQFSLRTPTPLPTVPVLVPTTPPLLTTLLPQFDAGLITATPFGVIDPLNPPTIVAYVAGTECAPQGLPVAGLLTQRFHRWHTGIDIGVPLGTPVVATHSGQVIFAGWSEIGYGYLVIIQSGAFITYYAHLTKFNVEVGQTVGRGSIIAWSGSTGNSTGPHVHYETRLNDVPQDPFAFEGYGYASC